MVEAPKSQSLKIWRLLDDFWVGRTKGMLIFECSMDSNSLQGFSKDIIFLS